MFHRKTLPENIYAALPEDFKKAKYNKVSKNEYFTVHKGYSFKIEKKDKTLTLTKSGISMTGNLGFGNIVQGFSRERQGVEIKEVELIAD